MPESLLQTDARAAFCGTRRALLRAVCAGGVVLAAGTMGRARAADPDAALLVATADLVGSMFARSVVLVMRLPGEETIGLILNRPETGAPGGTGAPGEGERGRVIHRGGPLAPRASFALGETAATPEGTRPVLDGVRFAAGNAGVKALLAATGEGRSKLFLGYAGWAPGQLAQEVAAGFWRARVVSAGALFDPDPATQWERLEAARNTV